MQELDSVMPLLSLVAKQDQPSLAAVAGGYGSAKRSHGHTAGGHSPCARGGATMVAEATILPEATMVEVALTSTLPHALLLPLLQKVQTVNRIGDRIVNNVGKTADATSTKWWSPDQCTFCNIAGHNIHNCKKLKKLKAETPQPQKVSFSTSAYFSACAVHEADACLSSSSPAVHAGTDTLHLSDVLPGIGPPVPCNAMPDSAAVNIGFALDPMGYVNALSSKGPAALELWR